MKERVKTYQPHHNPNPKTFLNTQANKSVILVAPHGFDDTNTNILVDLMAKELGCFAVMNNGFERSSFVDTSNDLADCNRVSHCTEDIVYDEFLLPIENFVVSIESLFPIAHIFYIHGCGDHVNTITGTDVGAILGYGLGSVKNSLTCWNEHRILLMHSLKEQFETYGYDVFQASANSKYAARDKDNLCQYYRKYVVNKNVQSYQLEIPTALRQDDQLNFTSMLLSSAIAEFVHTIESPELPIHQRLATLDQNNKFI